MYYLSKIMIISSTSFGKKLENNLLFSCAFLIGNADYLLCGIFRNNVAP